MTNTLSEIVWNKRHEVAVRKTLVTPQQIASAVKPAAGTFARALQEPGCHLITEIKPRSPSAGQLAQTTDFLSLSQLYSQYASAISVLTDEKFFGGSLTLLNRIATNVRTPILCKDFIVDPYQIYEARKAGAEAILLIAKILSDSQLNILQAQARALNMTAVVEIQNEEELHRALAIDPSVIMINNRDLSTFTIDLGTTIRLAPQVPNNITVISASGIEQRQQITKLTDFCRCFLIGSALMSAPDIKAKLEEFSHAGAESHGRVQ